MTFILFLLVLWVLDSFARCAVELARAVARDARREIVVRVDGGGDGWRDGGGDGDDDVPDVWPPEPKPKRLRRRLRGSRFRATPKR